MTLEGVQVHLCPGCGESAVVLPHIEELHRVLAHVLALKPAGLRPPEIRYLRKYLGFSGADYARAAGTTPETVSRWENGKTPMGISAERALRYLVLLREPIQSYPLEELTAVGAKKASSAHLRLKRKKNTWESRSAA